jgi:hypothetical protein
VIFVGVGIVCVPLPYVEDMAFSTDSSEVRTSPPPLESNQGDVVKMTGGFIKLTEACRIRNDFANFDKTVQ